MPEPAQTSADARHRPLVQYVISRVGDIFAVHRATCGVKGSGELLEKPVLHESALTLARARDSIPPGYRNIGRRKDDRVDVVEVWV
jgi:hypothetical protein